MQGTTGGKACGLLAAVLVIYVAPLVEAADCHRQLRVLPDRYPRVDGSTSTQPLGALVACRLTQTSFAWYKHPVDGTPRLVPTTDPYDPEKTLSLEHQPVPSPNSKNPHAEIVARTQHSGTHESYVKG
jgi:hypothetical protein